MEDCRAGFIVRDSKGEILMAGATPIGACNSVLKAKIKSILTDLEFAEQTGFRRLSVASDSLRAIQACKGNTTYIVYIGVVIQEILETLITLKDVQFEHEKKEHSKTTHELAKWGTHQNHVLIFIEEVPTSIIPFIVIDCNL